MRAARAGVLIGSLLVSACGVTQAKSVVRDGMSSRARPPTRGVAPGIVILKHFHGKRDARSWRPPIIDDTVGSCSLDEPSF